MIHCVNDTVVFINKVSTTDSWFLLKHPWRGVDFSKVGFRRCFSRFLNCKNVTKSCNTSHL